MVVYLPWTASGDSLNQNLTNEDPNAWIPTSPDFFVVTDDDEEEEQKEMPGDAAIAEWIAKSMDKIERMDAAFAERACRQKEWEKEYAVALEIERLMRAVQVALDAGKATGTWKDFSDENRKIVKQSEQLTQYLKKEIVMNCNRKSPKMEVAV